MSLKFGLYLVEQGIISCDQFCGLVKIQQMTVPSPGSVAIKKNLMSIKQVAQVLEHLELNPRDEFVATAQKFDFMDSDDARSLEREREVGLPSLRNLVVECGLMTSAQSEALYKAFEKSLSRGQQPDSPNNPNPGPSSGHRHVPLPTPKFRQRSFVASGYQGAY